MFYKVLLGSWRCIWRSKAPRRVCFFVWTAAWDKILTWDLMWWGHSMATWCWMCGCHGESVDHLLLHWSMAGVLWSFVFHSLGIEWVVSEKVVDFLFGWHNNLGKFSSDIWNLVPIWWGLFGVSITGVRLRMCPKLCINSRIVLLLWMFLGFGFHNLQFCFRICCFLTFFPYYYQLCNYLMLFVFILYAH